MATMLEHFKPYQTPMRAKITSGLPVPPAMTTIIVDRIPVVDPKLTSIIRNNAPSVMTTPVDSHSSSPTHSKMVTSGEAWPPAPSIPVIYHMLPLSQLGPAIMQILAMTALSEVECIHHEEAMAVGNAIRSNSTCTYHSPSICCVRSPVPEEHASVATMFEHFKPNKTPPMKMMSPGLSIAPAVQAVIVDCVSVVNPQLASIVRDNAESVMAPPEESHASGPTHSKMVTSGEAWPFATCVPVVHIMAPTSSAWPPTRQV
jgi:hypothetical protein